MSNLNYDNYRLRQQIVHVPNNTGLSIPGTAASGTVVLRIPIAADSVLLNRIRVRQITGGTAAGPNLAVGRSVGGTGTVSQIGTVAFGTSADGSVATTSLTTTEFNADDEIVLTNLAGTAASTPVIIFTLGYRDIA